MGKWENGKSDKLAQITGYARYQYDAIGQLIAQEKDGTSSTALTHYLEYDASDLVVAVYADAAKMQKKVSYAYDEGGTRVKKVNHVTTYYVGGVIYENEGTANGQIVQKGIALSGRIGVYRVQENQYTYSCRDFEEV